MLGAGSRRSCDEIISAGRVEVDGRRVCDPATRVVPGLNRVTLDKAPLETPPRPVVLILNKPAGYVCTVSDPQGRPTILDLCKKYARRRRLFPVGRLDFNTTGLILLTNDGLLCYRLTHPRFQIARTYQVRAKGRFDERKLGILENVASRSRDAARRERCVEVVRRQDNDTILNITLREGRNRQVRKMCESVGLRVVKLRRTRFGPLTIRNLPLGSVRPLEKKELQKLRAVIDQGT